MYVKQINRKDFWKNKKILSKNIFIDNPYLVGTLFNKKLFYELKKNTFYIIKETMKLDQNISDENLLIQINKTEYINIIKEKESFVKLDNTIYKIMCSLGLENLIKGIEFPANIRIAHGEAPSNYLEGDYSTDLMHSDLWVDEPEDIINTVIFIAGDVVRTKLDFLVIDDKIANLIPKYKGKYKNISLNLNSMEKIFYKPQIGQLFLWDGVVPHRTIRMGGKARISVEVRTRRIDPYYTLDDRWGREHIPWSKYWYFNRNNNFSDYNEKFNSELDKLHKNNKGYELRKKNKFINFDK